jgi:hypothetical protein
MSLEIKALEGKNVDINMVPGCFYDLPEQLVVRIKIDDEESVISFSQFCEMSYRYLAGGRFGWSDGTNSMPECVKSLINKLNELRLRAKINESMFCKWGAHALKNAQTREKIKKELLDMLLDKSFKYSPEKPFTLVSGSKSIYFVNCKPVTLHPRGMNLIGNLVLDLLDDIEISGIGGLTFGADPIAIASAYTSELRGKNISAFSIRKELKKMA